MIALPNNKRPQLRIVIFGIIGAFLFVLPFLKFPNSTSGQTSQFFAFIWIVALLGSLTAWGIWKKQLNFVWTPFLVIVGLWLGAKAIASYISILPHRSFWGAYLVWSDGLLFAVLVAIFAYILLVIRLQKHETKFLIQLLLIQSALVSLLTLLEVMELGITRPDSPLLNSDYFLSYSVLFLPLGLILLFESLRTRQKVATVAYASYVFITLAAMFVSLPTDLQKLVFPRAPRGNAPTSAQEFISNRANLERRNQWYLGYLIGKQHPWFGSGPGTTRAAYYDIQKTVDLASWDYATSFHHPHNDLIEQFSQTGLVGLITYLGLILWLLISPLRKIRIADGESKIYILGIVGGLVGFLILNQFLFTIVTTGIMLWIWVALFLTLTQSVSSVNLPNHNSLSYAILIAPIVLIILSVFAWPYFRAHQLVGLAAEALGQSMYNDASYWSSQAALRFPQEEEFNSVSAINNLTLYLNQSTQNSTKQPAFLQLIQNFAQQAVKRNPYIPRYVVDEGIIEYVTSNGEQPAIDRIDEGIAMAPKDYSLYIRVADVLATIGSQDLAKKYIERAIAIAPNNIKPKLENRLNE